MGYRSLRQCVEDLRKHNQLVEVKDEIDARLQASEIHRRVYRNAGPAILFSNVKGCRFSMVSNLFGTLERARFLFRDTIDNVRKAIELKIDPAAALRQPLRYWRAPLTAWAMRPKYVRRSDVTLHQTEIDQLPQQVSWPDDGGAFVTLPMVYTEDVRRPGLQSSNLGMYRIQLGGNQYDPNKEIGLHYQIHRSIGVHHAAAQAANKPLRVNVFVGGSPAMTLSAVMPLPEGMSELTFAGALAGYRIPMHRHPGHLPVYADADFCICGIVDPDTLKPEGPFGDHLGYYSLAHDFPVLRVERVYHREGAIWPFTVVGRPPQEDTVFGQLIHELTGPIIPTVLPGVKAVHAVDAAGVHPLLLAIGSERYTPFQSTDAPMEILTQANAILGQGQLSLAKYLWIIDEASEPGLAIHNIEHFLKAVLERVDWTRDLHFQTCTTIDTLDYSGTGFNTGSKLIIAAAGPRRRDLPTELKSEMRLPDGYNRARLCIPGVIAVEGPKFDAASPDAVNSEFCRALKTRDVLNEFPLVVVVDDAKFTSGSLSNFLWVTFTRSNPASDIYGIGSKTVSKHWGCQGSLVIDARIKPHHAPPLAEDPATTKFVDSFAAKGGDLAKYL